MAQSQGLLTVSGLLYEGNFDEWLPRMRAIVQQNNKFHFNNTAPSGELTYHGSRDRPGAANVMWCHTSPYIKLRVSSEGCNDPTTLIRTLRAFARPFRLLDLPPEIRLRIYRLSFPMPAKHHFVQRLHEGTEPIHGPPLLSTNRQILTEAMSVYYGMRHFALSFNEHIYSRRELRRVQQNPNLRSTPTGTKRTRLTNRWASSFRTDRLRHIRTISVQLPLLAVYEAYWEDMLDVSLKITSGKLVINVKEHAWLKPESQRLLAYHAATTAELAHSLKLQGEALVLFLTSRPEIWDQLELADQ
jgi:hypothetical protein